MKKVFFALSLLLATTVLSAGKPSEVNEKVLKVFNETFTHPKDVNWHEYEDYYEVSFSQDEIKTQVRYDSDGNVLGTIRYYSEKQLQPHILAKLKMRYPDRTIHGMITEIFSETDLQYYITMEDEKHWYTVVSNALGYLEQTEKFKKAPTK